MRFGFLIILSGLLTCTSSIAADACLDINSFDELEVLSSFIEKSNQNIENRGKRAPRCPDISEISETFIVMFEGAGGYDPQQSGGTLSQALMRIVFVPVAKKNKKNFVNYYANRHAQEAADCVVKLKAEAQKTNKNFKVKAVGYSMGGGAAIRFSQKLEKKFIDVDALFTIDPVARSYHSIPSLFGEGNSRNFFRRPANLKNWINHYQITDKKSMLVGIRGYSGVNADRTYVFQENDFPKWAHSEIMIGPEVMKSFKEWLND
jgi:hypothetical protein